MSPSKATGRCEAFDYLRDGLSRCPEPATNKRDGFNFCGPHAKHEKGMVTLRPGAAEAHTAAANRICDKCQQRLGYEKAAELCKWEPWRDDFPKGVPAT